MTDGDEPNEPMAALRRYRRLNALRHQELAGESLDDRRRLGSGCSYVLWLGIGSLLLFAGAATELALFNLLGGLAILIGIAFGVVWVLRRRGLLREPIVRSPACRAFMLELQERLRALGASDLVLEEDTLLGPTVDFLNRYWWGAAPTLVLDRLGLGGERRYRLEGNLAGDPLLVVLVHGASRSARSAFLRHPRVPHWVALLAGSVLDGAKLEVAPVGCVMRRSDAGLVVFRRVEAAPGSAAALADYLLRLRDCLAEAPARERVLPSTAERFTDPRAAGSAFMDALWAKDGCAALDLVDPELGLDLDWEFTPAGLLEWFEERGFELVRWEWQSWHSSLAGVSVQKRLTVTLLEAGAEKQRDLELQLRRRDGAYRVGFIKLDRKWHLGVEWDHSE